MKAPIVIVEIGGRPVTLRVKPTRVPFFGYCRYCGQYGATAVKFDLISAKYADGKIAEVIHFGRFVPEVLAIFDTFGDGWTICSACEGTHQRNMIVSACYFGWPIKWEMGNLS